MRAFAESHPYLVLKLAHQLFHKAPPKLEPAERQRVEQVARRQMKIEQRVLAAPEAVQVVLPPASLDRAIAEIRGRYRSEEEYLADLEKFSLDPHALADAVARDLKFDAVLEQVASSAGEATDTEVEIFYLLHRERFLRPENRTLRHILITLNENLPGSDRVSARRRIEDIHARLLKSPRRFAEQALKHSECPTAMNGGLLGRISRGQLYPELEPAAFAMRLDELSEVLESPVGFHLLHCAAIEEAGVVPLTVVRERIHSHVSASKRRSLQEAWIAALFSDRSGTLPDAQPLSTAQYAS